jgi:hypothetical protein
MENLFPTFIPCDKKLKSTLHPDNVQMVTARIEACKLYWTTGVHTIIRKRQFAHANLPVVILNVIFLISYTILKVLFTFYWKQTKMHIQQKICLGSYHSYVSFAACQLEQHLAAWKT